MSYQTVKKKIGTLTYSGGNDSQLDFKSVDARIGKYIPHLIALHLEAAVTVTGATAMTLTQLLSLFTSLQLTGPASRIIGRFGASNSQALRNLRDHERYELGRVVNAEARTGVVPANAKYFNRTISLAPDGVDKPEDFLVPVYALQNGGASLKASWAPAATVATGGTAIAATVDVYGYFALLEDEVRLGAWYERNFQPMTGKTNNLTELGKYLYAHVSKDDGTAFAVGDFGTVNIKGRDGYMVEKVTASALARMFNWENRSGPIGAIQGEQLDATHDVNQRQVDYSGATAIAAETATLQPLLWVNNRAKLTKAPAMVETSAQQINFEHTGNLITGASLHFGRVVPRSVDVMKKLASEAGAFLGGGDYQIVAATGNGRSFQGSEGELRFMPFSVRSKQQG